ncbi:MAG: TonB-dependent receptor [Pseudomonadota bacterium]
MKSKLLLFCSAALVPGWSAFAQDTSDTEVMDTIVVEADNRVETPLDETTRSVTVLTEEDLKVQRPVTRNIGDILGTTVPGFSPSNELQSDFGQTLRGRTFLTLIDGVPQSTPLRDGRRSLNSIDPDAIERIEIIRGGTAAFGFGATGGLINIVTKRPKEGDLQVNARIGVDNSLTRFVADAFTYEASADLTGRTGPIDYIGGVSFVSRGGFFDADGLRIPSDPVGVQGGIADSNSINIYGKVGYNFDNDRQRVQVGGFYYDFSPNSDFAGISFAGDPDLDIRTPATFGNANPVDPGTTNSNVVMEYTHEDLFGSSIKAQAYYSNIETVFGIFPGFNQTLIQSENLGGRLTINTPVPVPVLPFTLTWGIDALSDETQQVATALTIPTLETSPKADQLAIAGFGQVDIPIFDYGKISAGIRHERIRIDLSDSFTDTGDLVAGGRQNFSETLFNATGTIYITEELDLYGGFSQGFTVAEVIRTITDGTFTSAADADSEAQRTNSFEAGMRYNDGRFSGSIVGFLSTSDNGTTFEPGTIDIQRLPERITGIEATASAHVFDNFEIGGTFTWQRGRIDIDDDGDFDEDLPSTRIPPIKVTGFANYQPFDWWDARLQVTHVGTREPNSTAFGGTSDINSYTLVDLYSSFDIGPGELEIGVKNLLNNDYTPLINQAFDLSFSNARGPGITGSIAYRVSF